METIDKAGMLVNANGEVIGWINAGDQVDIQEGDKIISHPKTAEKAGLLDQFKTLKAENAPKKATKVKAEDGEEGAKRSRRMAPKTGSYTVVKTTAAQLKEGEQSNQRHELLTKLFANTTFESFWEGTEEKFEHAGRDGSLKTFATSGLVCYAIDRGMITVNA